MSNTHVAEEDCKDVHHYTAPKMKVTYKALPIEQLDIDEWEYLSIHFAD